MTADASLLASVKARLRGVRGPDANGWYTAFCPFHDDQHRPNLRFTDKGFKCLACAEKGSIHKLAEKLDVEVPQPFEDRIDATYDYRDEQGHLLFQVVRLHSPKGFRQRRPDGAGDWIWNLDGVRRVPYRLPELITADPGETVFIAEGEKDANRLIEAGLVATTNPGGAGKWRREYSQYLKGRKVVILPDNDDPGRHHAQQVAESLCEVASGVRILSLPDLPETGDVSDWLEAGGTAKALLSMASDAPLWPSAVAGGTATSSSESPDTDGSFPFKAECLTELLAGEDEPLDAIVSDSGDGAILTADGKGCIAAPTGIGKTNLLLRMSRNFCEASPFLGYPVPTPRRVLYLALEGSQRALRRRLRKVWTGADAVAMQRFYLAHVSLNLAEENDLERLDEVLYSVRPEVLIIDPLRNAHPWDENVSHEVARLTAILDAIIVRHRCAIIFAHHDRKRPPFARQDAGIDKVRGSTALTGWLSFCLSMDREPGGPKDRLVLAWTKTRDAESPLEPLVVDFRRDNLDFEVSEDAAVGGKVSDDAILNTVYQSGGSIRGTVLITGFVEGAGASERWVRERVRALTRASRLIEYVAPDDRKTRAKSYRLANEESPEAEP